VATGDDHRRAQFFLVVTFVVLTRLIVARQGGRWAAD
jgi:hypothetical protein